MRIVVIGMLLILTHILEMTLFDTIRIGAVAPNFMVMIIVSFALLRGSKEGAIIGAGAGLLYDVTFGMFLGQQAIPYFLVGYICGKFNKNFYRENFIMPFFCTLFSSFFVSLVSVLIYIMRGKVNLFFFLKTLAIPEVIYTVTLSLVFYQLIYLINEKLEIREKKTRNIF
ncbi:rod shape-determining protein MreD [Niameybacter massiliensis]|uniref:Rod shape-determining protein MreD n=1 Tax=Holtiella tumoricola TaxID=3018743 RepID=A0AA42J2F3_9FIRM|nr:MULTISPECIES: rod shape-determining protein MreD [Lachnospirales]MDA3733654.1 rod shape-determining protein MreD [Holtiella tumoricola]